MSQGITRVAIAAKCTCCGSDQPGARVRLDIGNVMIVLCLVCMANLHRKTEPEADDDPTD